MTHFIPSIDIIRWVETLMVRSAASAKVDLSHVNRSFRHRQVADLATQNAVPIIISCHFLPCKLSPADTHPPTRPKVCTTFYTALDWRPRPVTETQRLSSLENGLEVAVHEWQTGGERVLDNYSIGPYIARVQPQFQPVDVLRVVDCGVVDGVIVVRAVSIVG